CVWWCPRVRDYVNPWSVPGCGCGGGGVFVITDSWSWIHAGGFQTREHTGERINKLLRSSIQVQYLASIGVIGCGIQRF
ncbi:hypothetical protein ACQX3Y_10185, partial [Corynebacterium diphtheriae]